MTAARWLEPTARGIRLRIHVQPGAKRSETAGLHGDALKVRLQAPPIEGRANDELIRFLAKRLGCRRQQVTLVSGESSREKVVVIEGLAEDAVRRIVEENA